LPLAVHLDLEPLASALTQEADAVQTARDLVAVLVELAAGVEARQHDLDRRQALGRVILDRDAAAVVLDLDRAVDVDTHVDLAREAARASSTELSTTSQIRWWSPRTSVSPMYMAGRMRTASRPSRTVIESARYSALFRSFSVMLVPSA
jgi:hypothetical protein